jgi:hypothetical protein
MWLLPISTICESILSIVIASASEAIHIAGDAKKEWIASLRSQ